MLPVPPGAVHLIPPVSQSLYVQEMFSGNETIASIRNLHRPETLAAVNDALQIKIIVYSNYHKFSCKSVNQKRAGENRKCPIFPMPVFFCHILKMRLWIHCRNARLPENDFSFLPGTRYINSPLIGRAFEQQGDVLLRQDKFAIYQYINAFK